VLASHDLVHHPAMLPLAKAMNAARLREPSAKAACHRYNSSIRSLRKGGGVLEVETRSVELMLPRVVMIKIIQWQLPCKTYTPNAHVRKREL
jgi:hypothetical protein